MRATSLSLIATLAMLACPALAGSDGLYYSERSDWDDSEGKVNLSTFVFNDLNRNGVYDLGDRALAGVFFSLSRDGAPLAVSRSNAAGFANFTTSTSEPTAHIDRPGRYVFTALVPDGWRVTTANKAQTGEVTAMAGSPAGLVLRAMPHPVGLARDLFVRATYGGAQPGALELVAADGTRVAHTELTPGTAFSWDIAPGSYRLISPAGERMVSVGAYPVDLGQVGAAPASPALGRVIDFDQGAPIGLNKAPNGYGGLDWFNLNLMGADHTEGSIGYVNSATSGGFILYLSSGHPAEIARPDGFDFVSVNLTAAWPESEGEEAMFDFYRSDELVRRDRVKLSALGPVAYAPRVAAVTRVKISTAHYWQIAFDDLVVSTTP